MRPRWGSDRPSVGLSPEERRQFADIAARLRYELDGLAFDLPERRRDRLATALSRIGGRAARRITAVVTAWWLGPLLVALGAVALAVVAAADGAGHPGSGDGSAWVVTGWVAGVVLVLIGAGLAARTLGRGPAERGWASARSSLSGWRRARHDRRAHRSARH